MLIRLANHALLNPHMIDKLIVIRGLPHDWVFKTTPQGEELLPPWVPDVDANIPAQIRHLCTPIKYCRWYQDVRHYDRTYNGFWDNRTCWGLILDFNYGPAYTLWNKIVEHIEGTIPRTERMPRPVLVAPDHKSEFSPRLSRRDAQGHLELVSSEIPVIDLDIYKVVTAPTVTVASTPEPQIDMKTEIFVKCSKCDQEFKKTGLKRHMAVHRGEKVAA